MVHRASVLAELTQAVVGGEPSVPVAARLCTAVADILGADGVALTVAASRADRLVVCATDACAAALEEAQDVVSEGPTLDALRTRGAVGGLALDAQRRRWPLLAEMLESRPGPLTLRAFPVEVDGTIVGAVTLYQDGERALDLDEELARVVVAAIGGALLSSLGTTTVSHEGWAVRDRVDQATGMVAAQLEVPPIDALAVLRAHAFAHDTSLTDLSDRVLHRELGFERLALGG